MAGKIAGKPKRRDRDWNGGLVITSRPLLMLALLFKRSSYGLELIRTIRELTGGGIGHLKEGAVYRMLDQFEKEGLAESWLSEPLAKRGGRRRKYYRLTTFGRKQALDIQEELRRVIGPFLDLPVEDWTVEDDRQEENLATMKTRQQSGKLVKMPVAAASS